MDCHRGLERRGSYLTGAIFGRTKGSAFRGGGLSMGSFYGSIHVRTDDRPAVLDAAEAIARKGRARFLVSPVLRGWVTLFPNGSGQDESLSRTLARRLSQEIVQVIVHDDDIFCYAYYRDGDLVDQYNSRPDYFGAVSRKKKEQSRGRPEKLAPL